MMGLAKLAAGSLWSGVNWARRRLTGAGLLRSRHLGVRTISVGNLQAGGTGKTPIVIEIAREAIARGRVVCVLSRGYGGSASAEGKVVRPGEAADPAQVGDEPALIRARCPEAWLGVGRDRGREFGRASAIARALGRPIDLAILDDGFQHFGVRADVRVLAVTSAGRSARWFRDFEGEARRAELVVWTKGEAPAHAASRANVRLRWAPRIAERGPFHLVSGVGDPAELEESLRGAGVELAKHTRFRDHHAYTLQECLGLLAGARVLLTEKDAVKWKALGIAANRFVVIEREARFEQGRALWEKVLWSS